MTDVPRCSHDRVLGADDCPESMTWWAEQHAKLDAWEARQQVEARAIVRELVGLDADSTDE